MSSTEPASLRAETLAVSRGGRRLLAGLEFELRAGQVGLVTGPNGCGKTSLLRVMAGLSPPSAGRAVWKGTPVGRLEPLGRGEIVYQGHLDGLKKDLSTLENLRFYQRLWGADTAVPGDLLGELRLDRAATLPVGRLSAGQRRRVALAALKLRSAALWLLDEPATNLDTEGRAVVARWIEEHLALGGTALVATHQPEELARPGALLIELGP